MWELAEESATPHLAEALAAVTDHRADQAFEVGLTGLMNHARTLRTDATGGA
ncbi:hypothetical protein ACFU6S_36475 [Streptomyces sp. NPDC057456]|uniref:hypothetical protein n=1 Tax=Streptomyces sp. NPDC057456 TaxID=3346139 RepID=UPI0036AA1FD3